MNKSVNRLGVDLSPDYEMYKILQQHNYEIEEALAEFIDNSIQSFIECRRSLKAKSKVIDISVSNGGKDIEIEDNAGGISRTRFNKAMKPGRGQLKPHSPQSLSKFGIGLKTAAMWLTNTWNLETRAIRVKERIFLEVDLDKMMRSNDSSELFSTYSKEVDINKPHYTKITLKNCIKTSHLNKKRCEDVILPYVLETFHKFRGIKINLKFDGDTIEANKKKLYLKDNGLSPTLYERKFGSNHEPEKKNGRKERWEKKISFKKDKLQVRGYVRIMEEGSYFQPGIRLFRNKRVIMGTGAHRNIAEVIFGTKNKYGAQRIYGELHLKGFTVNYQKNGFDEGELTTMYSILKKKLEGGELNLIDQAANYRANYWKRQKKQETAAGKVLPNKAPTDKPHSSTVIPKKISAYGIKENKKIKNKLKQLKYNKLEKLYRSLCVISLRTHPIVMYIAASTFLEVLAHRYFGELKLNTNKKKSSALHPVPVMIETMIDNSVVDGVFHKREKQNVQKRIDYIRDEANLAKHHPKRSPSIGSVLKAHFIDTIDDFIIGSLDRIIKSKKGKKRKHKK